MSVQVRENLGNNMKKLREASGLTQMQMSDLSGIPRPTWANLESGTGNPTLEILMKVAQALQVQVEELVGPPKASAKFYAAKELSVRRRGKIKACALLPEPVPGIEFHRLELPPGSKMTGVPHDKGMREYLTCESGEIELTAAGTSWRLKPGELIVFRGDQKHSYRNPGRGQAIAYSMVAFAPGAS